MQEKIKKVISQWVIPGILVVIFLFGLLIQFRSDNEHTIEAMVESGIEQTGGAYCRNIGCELEIMSGVVDTMSGMLQHRGDGNISYLMQAIDAVAESSEAYTVVYCYADGNAVTTDLKRIYLKDTEYFAQLKGTESFFTYVKDDGISGNEAILYVSPVEYLANVEGYLLAYMEPALLAQAFTEGQIYGTEAFYAIVSGEGEIIETFGGVESTTLLKDNFWDCLRRETEIDGGWSGFDRNRINNEVSEMVVTKGEEQRILYQFPIENTKWSLVMGLNQSYANHLLDKVWNPVMELLLKILSCLIGMVVLVIAVNVFSRIKAVEDSSALEHKADTDQLTDLNNKIATERKIREYMEKHPDKQAVLFVLDLDNFKKINDTMGHSFGDEVLRSLGTGLRSMFRVSDIIGRIGGDEFIVFLKDVRDDAVIEREGRKLEKFFRQFEVGQYVKYSVTASVGGAVFPRDADTFEGLYKAADAAVYKSKKRGKNQLAFYKE